MKTIIRYLRKYWVFALGAPVLMLLEVFMDLLLPALMARIVDEGIADQNMQLVLSLGLRMILVTAVAFIGGSGCSIMSSYASTGLGADLRHDLFKKVQSLSYKNLDKLETGNLIIRLTSDVNQLEEVSRMMLRIMIRAPLQVVGSLVMAIMISPSLSLLFAVLIPLLLISLYMILKQAYPLFYSVQFKLDKLNTRIQENLAGKRLVKAFVREPYEKEKFAAANDTLMENTIKASKVVSYVHPVMQLLMNGGIIAALWLGAQFVDSQLLRVGSLIAFINYLRQLLFSLMMFSNLLMRFSRAQASSTRIEEVLNSTPDITDPEQPKEPPQGRGRIRFSGVSFRYNEQSDPVLKEITFSAEPGETVAILGATGSGKTSLANLIPRFYDIDAGSILLDGIDIRSYPLENLRKQIAVVPQQTILFSGSVRDNILYHYSPEEKEDPAMESLMKECAEIANIDSFIDGLPEGYDTNVNQRGVNLSGGQKQRIAIARALAKQTPVLILDDSTSSVDLTTEKKIQSALNRRGSSQTRIIIAQRISSVMQADRILILDDGMISGIGTHQELLENNAIYQEIYYSQIDQEEAS